MKDAAKDAQQWLASGNIVVQSGIFGKGEGFIKAGKSLWAKFINDATVEVEENVIVTDSIVNSNVTAMKNIVLRGKDRPVDIKLIVNRVHSADEGKRISERIINIVGQFLNYKVEYLGFVYEDPVVQASVIRQKPFIFVNPTSKPSVCMKHIVGKIEKTEPEYNDGVSTFLKKFLSKKPKA